MIVAGVSGRGALTGVFLAYLVQYALNQNQFLNVASCGYYNIDLTVAFLSVSADVRRLSNTIFLVDQFSYQTTLTTQLRVEVAIST